MRTDLPRSACCLVAALFLASIAIGSHAQSKKRKFETDSRAQQEALAQAMKQNSYSLSFENDTFSGSTRRW